MTAPRLARETPATTGAATVTTWAPLPPTQTARASLPPAGERRPASGLVAPGSAPPALVPEAVAALLAALLDEVRGLRADLARRRGALTRKDRARLGRLLPPIAAEWGSEPFVTRDLFDDDTPPALQLVVIGLNAYRVGCLFQRGEGRVVGGYVVMRDGSELGATRWCVFAAPNLPEPRGSSMSSRPLETGV